MHCLSVRAPDDCGDDDDELLGFLLGLTCEVARSSRNPENLSTPLVIISIDSV